MTLDHRGHSVCRYVFIGGYIDLIMTVDIKRVCKDVSSPVQKDHVGQALFKASAIYNSLSGLCPSPGYNTSYGCLWVAGLYQERVRGE